MDVTGRICLEGLTCIVGLVVGESLADYDTAQLWVSTQGRVGLAVNDGEPESTDVTHVGTLLQGFGEFWVYAEVIVDLDDDLIGFTEDNKIPRIEDQPLIEWLAEE